MGNINSRVKGLKPHVLSIRFTENVTVVDCEFKNNWTVPKSHSVGHEKLPNKNNFYMLYPLEDNVGIDEMLDYVDYVIKVNVERELKIQLLELKINELKQIFINNSLEKCKTVDFSFKSGLDSEEVIDFRDMPIYNEVPKTDIKESVKKNKPSKNKSFTKVVKTKEKPKKGVNGKIDGDVPEVQEISEEELSDSKYNIKPTMAVFNNEEFELPPSRGDNNNPVKIDEFKEPNIVCKCDPNDSSQVCPVCIDSKY